jgi:hypothetical protein
MKSNVCCCIFMYLCVNIGLICSYRDYNSDVMCIVFDT